MSNTSNGPPVPSDWFYLPPESIRSGYNQSNWPWTEVTEEELIGLVETYQNYIAYNTANVSQKVMYTFCALGILGGCLIMATIARMPKSSRTNFYRITNVIAALDLAFLVDIVIRRQVSVMETRTTAFLVVMFITSGTVYSFSLISDLLTLALSVERFVALTFPTRYKQMGKTVERRVWNGVILLSTVVSLCRARYAFGNAVYTIHSVADTTFFLYLTYFSDMIVPVVTATIMILMVAAILRALLKRTWSKVTAGNQILQKHISDCMKTMSLLAVLMVMFLLNQCNYIYYELEYVARTNAKLSFDSSLDEARAFLRAIIDLELAGNCSTVAEIASKTFTFYTYTIFSANFRKYFLSMLRLRRDADSVIGKNTSQTNFDRGMQMHTTQIFVHD